MGGYKFAIRTYGCQMNSRDSENMAAMMESAGFSALEGDGGEDEYAAADVVIFNTCCVRESAEDRFLGHLGRLKPVKAAKPELVIAVSGCMSQQERVKDLIAEKYPYVNIVIGTGNRQLLPGLVLDAMAGGGRAFDISAGTEWAEHGGSPLRREFRHRAGINIMRGCGNFCSYCIVPYVRGPEVSRGAEGVIREAEALAKDGVREIMLLGQNVNSYRPQGGGPSFAGLARAVAAVAGVERVRFMTSHPKDFSDELIAALRDTPKLCGHVHLPMQSGSTRVLAAMNRGYTKERYLELVEKLRAQVPGAAITTDIIVGFPGESDEDFRHTLDAAEKARFAGAFTFIYSSRSGTPAASMHGTVPEETAKKRLGALTGALYPMFEEHNRKKVGRVLDAMVEAGQGGVYKGRLPDNGLVHFRARAPFAPGSVVPVRITEARTFYVLGEYDEKTTDPHDGAVRPA